MTIERPTLSELRDRISSDFDASLPGADSRLRRSVLSVLGAAHAGALHSAYGYMAWSADVLPDSKRDDVVLRWAAIMAVARIAAAAATGNVTATGTDGSVIPSGTVLVSADGRRYVTAEAATIAGGTAVIPLDAEDAGAAGDIATGQTLTFVSPIAGVTSTVVTAGAVDGGVDEESIASLRARLLERFREKEGGGKDSDWAIWVKEVEPLARVWVTPNVSGLGTVGVQFVITGRDDVIPTSDEIDAVEAHLELMRPVCADLVVSAPIATVLNFTIALTPNLVDVKAAVEAELRDLLAREAEPGGTLLISHIREAISIAAGETDHVLTSPSANVTATAGHIRTFGAITWS